MSSRRSPRTSIDQQDHEVSRIGPGGGRGGRGGGGRGGGGGGGGGGRGRVAQGGRGVGGGRGEGRGGGRGSAGTGADNAGYAGTGQVTGHVQRGEYDRVWTEREYYRKKYMDAVQQLVNMERTIQDQTLPCLQVSATQLDDLFISNRIIVFPSDETTEQSSNRFHASCILADKSSSIHQHYTCTV